MKPGVSWAWPTTRMTRSDVSSVYSGSTAGGITVCLLGCIKVGLINCNHMIHRKACLLCVCGINFQFHQSGDVN